MSTETIRLIRDGIIIMKGIYIVFLVPMYHSVWECRELYSNTNNKHTHGCLSMLDGGVLGVAR